MSKGHWKDIHKPISLMVQRFLNECFNPIFFLDKNGSNRLELEQFFSVNPFFLE